MIAFLVSCVHGPRNFSFFILSGWPAEAAAVRSGLRPRPSISSSQICSVKSPPGCRYNKIYCFLLMSVCLALASLEFQVPNGG